MRETVLSNCEKAFVEKAILENLRIDKRELGEFRNLGIFFGQTYGSVICSLGETRVFAQVSCEVSTPKATRPNEGTIFINVEIGPMAAPHFEVGFPLSESCIQINRILERTLRESRCIDLESLCIIAEEKVWNIRVDIAVLNHEGNVMDCSCIAAVAALAHFKRPDVTTSGDGEFIIHTAAEKDLIPTVLHHYPICVSYALFDNGKIPVSDPTALEERVSDASLVLAVNSYRELCSMHLAGVVLTSPRLILKCSELAAERAKRIVEFIKSTLEEDTDQRAKGNVPMGFAECIRMSKISSLHKDEQNIEMESENETSEMHQSSSDEDDEEVKPVIQMMDSKTVASNKWENSKAESSEESSSSDDEAMPETPKAKQQSKVDDSIVIVDSSEEDETVVLK